MVTRLQEAFEEVSKLPPDEQERWAERIFGKMAELASLGLTAPPAKKADAHSD
jgi:hypothetical protein